MKYKIKNYNNWFTQWISIKTNFTGFTLVELIVVITILAILWTIAFIALQWYSKDARDSTRVSDIANIKTSLELFSLEAWKYPNPDNYQEMTYTWWIVIRKQWTIWENATSQMSRQLNEIPTDPLYDTEYIYSVTSNQFDYQLSSLNEWDIVYNNIELLRKANATKVLSIKVSWTYNWLFIKTWNYIIPTPSLITSIKLPAELNEETISSQVIDDWPNIPYMTNLVDSATWWLTFNNFEVYEWELNNESGTWDILAVYDVLKNTYEWSSVENEWNIKTLLSQTNDDQKIALIETTVLNKAWSTLLTSTNDSNWLISWSWTCVFWTSTFWNCTFE